MTETAAQILSTEPADHRRLLAGVIDDLPHPDGPDGPIQLVESPGALVLLIQRGAGADAILPTFIAKARERFVYQLAQWVHGWGHGDVPFGDFLRTPWKYAQHQRGIVVVDELVIPDMFKRN